MHLPRTFQTSIGFQRQFGDTMAVEADYLYSKGTHEKDVVDNINLKFDPATGANLPFANRANRPYPDWGVVSMNAHLGRSAYHAVQTGFTKRFSDHWQASATYTLSGYWDANGAPDVGFKVAPDLGGEYTLAAGDQRHRAVFNGIWQLKHGLQLSGLYFFGSGVRFPTSYGGDVRGVGVGGVGRLRPDGTLVARNNFVGKPIHRVDLRAQQRIRLVGRASIDGMFEVFNLFNHANYGSYTTVEALGALYGQPSQNSNVAFQPRMLQLGFRFAF